MSETELEYSGAEGTNQPEDDFKPEEVQNKRDLQRKFCEKWFKKINRAKEEYRAWHRAAKAAQQRYTSSENEYENESAYDKVWYPLFWSNVQVIRGAIYTSTPIPDVRRRNEQGSPVRSQVAVAVERGLEYFIDTQDFDGNLSRSLIDNLVAGLGQVRLNYDADVDHEPVINPLDGQPMLADDGVTVIEQPIITNQKVILAHVPWKQFIYEPCMAWEDCTWVDYVSFLDRKEVMEQFDFDPKVEMIGDTKKKGGRQKYEVHEVWDKSTKRVIFLLTGLDRPMRIMKDNLGVKNFFPSPKPLVANVNPEKFEAITDYSYYSAQDLQVDRLTRRIMNLTSTATVARGFYDASIAEELETLATADDTEYIPVANLMAKLQQAGGGGGGSLWNKVVADYPIEMVVKVIRVLQEQRESELAHVYQITGISDIMRGSSKASETATAQEIKASAATSRISIRLGAFNNYVREIFEIVSDIEGGHFTAETWFGQTGIEVTEEMDAVLKNDLLREYAIDVETDSTILHDSAAEKQQHSEAIAVMTNTLQTLLPMMREGLMPADVVINMVKLALHPFKQTHAFEDAISQLPNTMQQMQQMQEGMQQGQEQIGQLTQQLQQAMAKLQEFEMREEARKDLTAEAEAEKDFAQADKYQRDAGEPYNTGRTDTSQ